MLMSGFFNLAASKEAPVVKVGERNGAIEITLTDQAGDGLEIVLRPETLAEIVSKAGGFSREYAVQKMPRVKGADQAALPARLLSKAEVAEYLGVSKKVIDRYVRTGKLPFIQLGRKKFNPADVRAFAESRTFNAPQVQAGGKYSK